MNIKSRNHVLVFGALLALGLVLFGLNIMSGSERIPFGYIFGLKWAMAEQAQDTWRLIIWEIRLPRAALAVVAGAATAVAGMLLQALFRNPIAGPDALGVTSGAALGAAVLVFGGKFWGYVPAGWILVLASSAGAFGVLLLVLGAAHRIRDTATVLILGLLIGAASSAVVMLLQHFGTQDELARYTAWMHGNLGGAGFDEVGILLVLSILGLAVSSYLAPALDALLMGDDYARSMGVSVKSTRQMAIVSASLLAGSVTAFCGPIAFLGIVAPHGARILLKKGQHRLLVPTSALIGAIALLLCDLCTHLPGDPAGLPLNAITALLGVPATVALVIRR